MKSGTTRSLSRPRLLCVLALLAGLLSGCGEISYKDGTYEALSSPDEDGAYARVVITFADNQITACEYVTYQRSGEIKDENYGREAGNLGNSGFYERAQRAVAAMKIYRQKLLEQQHIEQVDKISGATIAYDQFTEAVHLILDQAAQD